MINRYAPLAASLVAAAALVSASSVFAQEAGTRTASVGIHTMDPAGPSDISTLFGDPITIEATSGTRPSIGFEYFVRDRLGVELHAAGPYQTYYDIPELGRVGSARSVPVTLSLQYHFGDGKIRPFGGGGVSYSHLYHTRTLGTEAGGRAAFHRALGVAAHAGLDLKISERSAIRIDARWIDMDTDLIFEGVKLGTVEMDPLLYGVSYVLVF
jgi:outer membrane protein